MTPSTAPTRKVPPAVILAAGRGNRLLPLTSDRPKCLLETGGKTIIEHQIRALQLAGTTKIHLVTGYGAARVRQVCDGVVRYWHNPNYAATQSLDSLGCVEEDAPPEGLIVLNSDVLFHPKLLTMLLGDSRENVLLADFRQGLGEEEMKIIVGPNHRIMGLSKTMNPTEAHAENLGVLRLGQAAAQRMLELARMDDRAPVLHWVPDGIDFLRDEFEFHALPTDGLPWIEVDYPHDLAAARDSVYPKLRDALWAGRQ